MLKDLKHAVAALARERSFTSVALLTLALAIGANAAIFSVINAVLLEPLPYAEPDRLVTMYNLYPKVGVVDRGANAVPDYFDRRAETGTFEQVAMLDFENANVGAEGSPERVVAIRVTPTTFPLLRVQPALGRPFTEEDAKLGNERVALLTHAQWQKQFASDPNVLGKSIQINGVAHEIVGVMPRDFELLDRDARLLMPLAFTPEQTSDDSRHSNSYAMLARLGPGVTVAQAQERLNALNQRITDAHPQFREVLASAGFWTRVIGLQDEMVREVRPYLVLVQGGVALVLAIGCVNVANLMLVRSHRRKKELAVRFALGAGRGRVVRALMVESLVLAAAGGALGLGVGWAATRLLARFAADQLPRGAEVAVDWTVLGFTFLVALGTGLLFGLIPAFQALHASPAQAFREGGRSGTSGRTAALTRSSLVVFQFSLAFVLLVLASLLLLSFRRVTAVPPGFESRGVLSALVNLPEARYRDDAATRAFIDSAGARLRSLPGVEAVGLTTYLPFGGSSNASVITIDGYALAPGENPPVPHFSEVDGGYFDALGIRKLAGRNFEATDTSEAQLVVMIDQRLAERYFPQGDAVGRRIRTGFGEGSEDSPWRTIVGVVAGIRSVDLTDPDTVGNLYFPLSQRPSRRLALAVRTAGDPVALTNAARQEILRLDPELPLFDVKTMDTRLSESLATRRAPMVLLAIFAGVALALSAVGIYGVIAYTVSLRTREIGIRSALGAAPSGVASLVLMQGGRLILIGMVLGIAGALGANRLLESLLYEVRPSDPSVFAAASLLLAAVGLVACLAPSVRAAQVDPVVVLRED